jgi:hypothetical protein
VRTPGFLRTIRAESLQQTSRTVDERPMDLPSATPRVEPLPVGPAAEAPESQPDAWVLPAVDANALAHAIRSGRGHDVSRLVTDLLRSRDAA